MPVLYNNEEVTIADGAAVRDRTAEIWEIQGVLTAEYRLTELDQVDPAGRFRIVVSADVLEIQHALTAEWATDTPLFSFSSTGVVVNEDGLDVDFRVEGSSNTHLFHVDAGQNHVEIGSAVGAGSNAQFMVNFPAETMVSGGNWFRTYINSSNTLTTFSSGSHAIVASLRVDEANITLDGTGAVTASYTIYAPEVSTEATNNFGAFIAGKIQMANTTTTTRVDSANGMRLQIASATVNGNNDSGTVAIGASVAIGVTTYTNDNATLTITQPTALYITGIPVAGSNVTFTNTALAMWVETGSSRFDGAIIGASGAGFILTSGQMEFQEATKVISASNTNLTLEAAGSGSLFLQTNGTADVEINTVATFGGLAIDQGRRIQAQVINVNAVDGTTAYGVYGQSLTARTGSEGTLIGVGIGGIGSMQTNNAQNLTNVAALRGLEADIITQGSAGVVTGSAGLYVKNATINTATITNQYGVYIEDLTSGTTDYGVYIVGADTAAIWVASADPIHVGVAGASTGKMEWAGATSGVVTVTVATTAGTWTLTLPADGGSSGEQLQTNGSGVATWEAAGSLEKYKIIVGSLAPRDAMDRILGQPTMDLWKYRETTDDGDRVISTGDHETVYAGVMAENFPEVMHHDGKIFSPVSAFGYTVATFQAMAEELANLKQELEALR